MFGESGGPPALTSRQAEPNPRAAAPDGSDVATEAGAPENLTPSQRAAVEHGDGPLLVVAGAGTGKTSMLASRVARLLERGVAPERVLLITFTRRAAQEMLERARRLTGDRATARVVGGTFHAVANRVLRLHGRAVGVRPDFSVLDQADAADVLDLVRTDLGHAAARRRLPRKSTLASIYSRTVNAGEPLRVTLKRAYPWCVDDVDAISAIFGAYVERKRAQNALDYDDLLLHWHALARAPDGAALRRRFDHILVDEYQDTNALEAGILRAMRRENANLTVVGDEAQSIYGFRAATIRNILEFERDFSGATVIKLERNFRSTQPILDVANGVIAQAAARHEKTLSAARRGDVRPVLITARDEAEQSVAVCEALLEHRERGVPLRRQAVLFRAAHHSDQLEVELTRRNIPFVKYGGLRFLEAAHVKDLVSVLRIVENPSDEIAWFRVLQLLDGVGPRSAGRIVGELGVRLDGRDRGEPDDGPRAGPLARLLRSPPDVPDVARRELADLAAALRDCASVDGPPAPQVERVRAFLDPIVLRRYDNGAVRVRDLEQLEQIASRAHSRATFLADLALDPPASTGDLAGPPMLDEDYVILSTIHSAKGCEWDVVHVIHVTDGMIPSDMATGDAEQVDEERRLLYVAITRARDALYVHVPMRYYRRPRGLEDAHSFGQISRFLTPDVQARFERHVASGPDGASGPDPVVPGDEVSGLEARPAAAVDDYLASLWTG